MFIPNEKNAVLKSTGLKRILRLRVIGFCLLTAAVLFCGDLRALGEVELADAPLFTKINPPPTNLMMLLDDSGSMLSEILVKGNYDGYFPPVYTVRGETRGFCYVFDDMGDNYNYTDSWRYLGEEGRKYWRSQWYEVNVLYYNPDVIYEPWASHTGQTFLPADTRRPLVHPLQKITLDLTQKAFSVGDVTIPWSHYFVQSNGTAYLVIIDGKAGQNEYYIVTTDLASEPLDKIVTLTLETNPPEDIVRDHDFDLQNFANWFTYHRRREFVAKAAIGRVLSNPDLDDARIGFLGINKKIIVPLKPVRAVIGGLSKDETNALLESLYEYKSGGGTPLKTGLEAVGKYYQSNDGRLQGEPGDAPYPADGGACQQSFTIIVTDGYYSDSGHNFEGNTDGSSAEPYGDWGGGSKPFSDAYSDSLADTAMYFYATDLHPTLDNQVPVNKWDGAAHQHMVTFAVAFGVSGTLNFEDYEDDRTSPNYMKLITKKDEPREYGDYVVWPAVSGDRQPESIDDLWHATVNGRGVFVHAGEPQKLVEGMLDIIKDIKERQPTSSASVTVNGDYLFGKIGPDVLIFQGSYSYIDNQWGGDVQAYRVDEVTGNVLTDKVEWSAADKLQAKAWNSRNILTFDGDQSGQWFVFSELTGNQIAKLGPQPEKTVNFIRGKDPGSSGNRVNMMADVVHSSPVFHDGVVYVGGNGGLLYAFNASDGTEIFAYMPYLLTEYLGELVDINYDHRFYVDLTPTVQKGEKLLGGTGDEVILVGGLGKGAMGYFALDVTHPLSMSPGQVLWEFPRKATAAADVADMGYSFSQPVVARSYNSAHPWVVITGNGYNSPNGDAVLFILDAVKGDVVRKIQTGSGPDNGLSSPIAVDVDHDDVVDFVYAGDLKGNLWKFDLISNSAVEWNVAFKNGGQAAPLFVARDGVGKAQPITSRPDVMFHPEEHGLMVCFGTGKFLSLSDYADQQVQTLYGIWDYGDTVFEAGKGWSTDDDREFLGAIVSRNRAVRQLSSPFLTESVKLLKQTATDHNINSGGENITVRVLTEDEPFWLTRPDPDGGDQLPDPHDSEPNDAGWYLDLDINAGERIIGDVILRDGILIAIGFIPAQTRCVSGGESVFMELNAFTGGSIGSIQFDINDDGFIDEKDLVEVEIDGKMVKVPPSGFKLAGHIQPPAIIKLNKEKEKKYLSSSGGGIVEITEKAAKTGIAYWMEIRE